jgi:hypothetical protein
MAALLAGILGQGAPPVAAPAPRQPTLPRADLIADALEDPAAEQKALYISADDLGEFGADAATLEGWLAQRGLHVAANFDGGQGGVLLARAPEILTRAEELKDQGKPVPIIPVKPAPPPKAGAARALARPDGPGVPSATAVKPLAPALEERRLDRARQHIKEIRRARNYETPVDWWEPGRVSG